MRQECGILADPPRNYKTARKSSKPWTTRPFQTIIGCGTSLTRAGLSVTPPPEPDASEPAGLPIDPQDTTAVPTTQALKQAQEAIGYKFKDRRLLEQALTHASLAETRLRSNERLEFFGDAVLGMIVCEELYKRFGDHLEGELTKIKSAVVSRRTCEIIARKRGLDLCLLLGKGISDRDQLPNSLSAAVYEALIGAIYLDGGLEAASRFVLEDMTEHIIAAAESENQQNYKSHLQQHAQKHTGIIPIYEVLDEKGPDHSKCFEVCVTMLGKRYPSAWGTSKKEAEQKAAYNALKELQILPDDPDVSRLRDNPESGVHQDRQ